MNLIKIENSLEKLEIPNYVLLISIIVVGFLIRVSITYWDIFLESSDAFLFLLEARDFSTGNFEKFGNRPVWPLILTGFFSIVDFKEIISYMNIIRIVSITISCVSVFVIFKIGKKFLNERYALFIAALFAFDPSLIQNSILGIREPIFILLGIIALYYGMHKNEKFLLLAFLFAGLSLDARMNGIAIPIFLSIFIILRFKSIKKILYWLVLGIGIFLVISIPNIIVPLEQGDIPFVKNIIESKDIVDKGKLSPSTYNESNKDADIIETSFIREMIHLIRISLPLAGVLAIIGLFSWVKTRDFKFYALISSLCVIFIIAFPMYFLSAEYRNLLLASPFLFLIAGVGLEKNLEKLKIKKTILVILVVILFISSLFMINLLDNRGDRVEIIERENVAQIIIQEFSGRFMGDLFTNISHNIPDVKHAGIKISNNTLYYNKDISITIQPNPISTVKFLMDESKRLGVDYLVIDNKLDNRYPIFEKIFNDEKNFPYLEKEYEYFSDETEFQVKVFKINYDVYWQKEN